MNAHSAIAAENEILISFYFFKFSASAGLGAALAGTPLARPPFAVPGDKKNPGELNVAFIGTGAQGRMLIESCLRIPGIRIAAICDIWEYSQRYAPNYLKKYGRIVSIYEDYRDLLGQEKNLQAAIVATPDWMHAEQANACLEAGLHVYCEKEMSNSLDNAKIRGEPFSGFLPFILPFMPSLTALLAMIYYLHDAMRGK
jgi:hypothetical protein